MLKLSKVKKKILLNSRFPDYTLTHSCTVLTDHYLRCQTQMVDGVLCLCVLNPQFVVVFLEQERSVKMNKIKKKWRQIKAKTENCVCVVKTVRCFRHSWDLIPILCYPFGLESHLQLTEKPGFLSGRSQLLTISSRVWCGGRHAQHVSAVFFYVFSSCGWPEWQGLPFAAQSTLGWLVTNFGEVNPGFHLRVVWCAALQMTFI